MEIEQVVNNNTVRQWRGIILLTAAMNDIKLTLFANSMFNRLKSLEIKFSRVLSYKSYLGKLDMFAYGGI